ncbi:MAG: tRNA dihydrouridine synthase DusB [Clostridia bacterium]|nr:tRNA dihydrouridine synthase DusB [Clostridia bacterium]
MTINQIFNTNSGIPVVLAPMAGVTDLPFREVCTSLGCDFSYSEMVSAKALSFKNKKTHKLMSYSENSMPFGIQIFGHEPHVIGNICSELCSEYGDIISLIDINMGCPAPKIVNNGDGCALMNDVLLASKVIEYAVKASTVPVTVKFRKGWDSEHENALEFAKMAENSGASAVAIHGRTRVQMYSGKSDWDIIAAIKSALKIPVIGNGDITDADSAIQMLNHTKCDALMIGRAAQGNPFIFDEIKSKIKGRNYIPPTLEKRISIAEKHLKLHEMYKSQAAFPEMRKHIAWYTKGIHGASTLRSQIFLCESAEEALELLNKFRSDYRL